MRLGEHVSGMKVSVDFPCVSERVKVIVGVRVIVSFIVSYESSYECKVRDVCKGGCDLVCEDKLMVSVIVR